MKSIRSYKLLNSHCNEFSLHVLIYRTQGRSYRTPAMGVSFLIHSWSRFQNARINETQWFCCSGRSNVCIISDSGLRRMLIILFNNNILRTLKKTKPSNHALHTQRNQKNTFVRPKDSIFWGLVHLNFFSLSPHKRFDFSWISILSLIYSTLPPSNLFAQNRLQDNIFNSKIENLYI